MIASTTSTAVESEHASVVSALFKPNAGANGGQDTELTLSSALSYTHLGVSELHNGHELEMRAEVAVISRPTIEIKGSDFLLPHYMFKMMALQKQGMFLKVGVDGILDLSGVKVRNGGCHFDSLTCAQWVGSATYGMIVYQGTKSLVSLQGCVIQPHFGHGIVAKSGGPRRPRQSASP